MGKMEFETVTYQRNNIVTDIIHWLFIYFKIVMT